MLRDGLNLYGVRISPTVNLLFVTSDRLLGHLDRQHDQHVVLVHHHSHWHRGPRQDYRY